MDNEIVNKTDIEQLDKWVNSLDDSGQSSPPIQKKIRHPQSPARRAELLERKTNRKNRVSFSRMIGVAASINRRSNDPHIHAREKLRNIRNGKISKA